MQHVSDFSPAAAPRSNIAPTNGPSLVRAISWLEHAFRTARERRQLMALDTRALKDIGLSRADADGEWSRPFWDLPRGR
jgi:uncharacterized protein YjiS (DUF1127 family)